jgi:hypothetical protein
MVTNTIGPPVPVAFNLEQFISDQDALARQTSDSGNLNPALIFGDFVRITQILINAITFQYFLAVLQVLPFPHDFVLTVQAIGGSVAFFTIAYLISGRSTKLGP